MRTFASLSFLPLLLAPQVAPCQVYHVATDGSDSTGDGSPTNEWATISHAVDHVPDGAEILVGDGTYNGVVSLDQEFASGITIRAQNAYRARLRHDAGAVVRCYYGRNITLEGFDIAHDPDNTGALVVQIQDLLGDGPGAGTNGNDPQVSGIILRNNILHDSTNNDILKINNGATRITVEGNIFYNQSGSDEHIDINSVTDVIVQDNIFFNDFAASGRTNDNSTSSYVVVKDSNGDDDDQLGSERITIRRNIFLNWEGSSGQGFLRFGEDGTANFEVDGALVENNLLIGNSANLMRSAFTFQGVANITVRHNTVVGDLPSRAFAARFLRTGGNQPNTGILLANNLFSDPTGTMGTEALIAADFIEAADGDVGTVTLVNNLLHNGGGNAPADATQAVRWEHDPAGVTGNPLLPPVAGLQIPNWDEASGTFGSAHATIGDAFAALATIGLPGSGSPARNAADPAHAPGDDLRGVTRRANPDIGAVDGSSHPAAAGSTGFHLY